MRFHSLVADEDNFTNNTLLITTTTTIISFLHLIRRRPFFFFYPFNNTNHYRRAGAHQTIQSRILLNQDIYLHTNINHIQTQHTHKQHGRPAHYYLFIYFLHNLSTHFFTIISHLCILHYHHHFLICPYTSDPVKVTPLVSHSIYM
ncbi:hypothetical protein BDB00DRAFT_931301 [Zychaea mexicana]|uniref:uncharacterized protein n=1 Tax=Zychaea mexicana TaxID=64656 RepID=UPI0022FDD2F9|nr:uncharacterized protein BDB00DRAFT_931301 [Zychaea mexicana]KAI9490365.1 hypothetical protein BDB00DRAFT_931301 [Zychaea mexicana]